VTDNSTEPFDHFDDIDENEDARELTVHQKRERIATGPSRSRSLSRRKLLAGAGTLAGATAIGIAGANAPRGRGISAAPTSAPTTEIRFAQEVATPPEVATPSAATIQLPNGTALVTSPRLPLHGIGTDQVQALLQGAITSWRDVGSPINLPVSAFAIDGIVPDGMKSPQMVKDYAGLLDALNKTPGGMAVVPIDQIDFRANTLALGEVNPLATGDVVRIAVTGDIIPGRNVAIHARKYGDWTHPFLQVRDFLAGFDLTVSNFECVISDTIAPPEETDPNTFDFIASSDVIQGMKLCGIDAISLANNHTAWSSSVNGDVGPFTDMLGILDNAGFPYFGGGRDLDQAQRGWEATVGNTSIVFIGIDGVTANVDYADQAGTVGAEIGSGFAGATASKAGTNPLAVQSVMAKIADLAGKYDIVIPYFHMGEEFVWVTPDWCVDVAHAAIDNGATLVLTNHPHLIQGMEIYKEKPIVYSLGNFVFDQMFSVDTRTGYILDLTFQGKKVVGLRTHGFEIEDFNQPRLMSAGEHAGLMDRFWRSTDIRTAKNAAR
jgi:hypothetical protein